MEKHLYYHTGAVYTIENHVKGSPHGLQQYFYEDGTKKAELNYEHGLLHGEVILYFRSGQLRRRASFHHGKRHGRDDLWTANGQPELASEFIEGQPTGQLRYWYPNGVLAQQVQYHSDLNQYDIIKWNGDGTKMVEGLYDEQGNYLYREWTESGRLRTTKKGRWDGQKLLFD